MQVQLTGTLVNPDGSPMVGHVVMRPQDWTVDTGVIVSTAPAAAPLDASGAFTLTIASQPDQVWRLAVVDNADRTTLDRPLCIPGRSPVDVSELL